MIKWGWREDDALDTTFGYLLISCINLSQFLYDPLAMVSAIIGIDEFSFIYFF